MSPSGPTQRPRTANALARPQARNFSFREPGFREHFVGMGTKFWRWMAQTRRGIRKLHWKADHTHDPAGALIDFDHHVLRLNLRVSEDLGHREHLPARYPGGI